VPEEGFLRGIPIVFAKRLMVYMGKFTYDFVHSRLCYGPIKLKTRISGQMSVNREMYIEYWWESQKERGHQEDQYIGEWVILKLIVGVID
jgi:hypothetical protein